MTCGSIRHDVENQDGGEIALDPEMSYLEYLQPSLRRPEYWSNLGSSKNRTSAQQAESRNVVENLIKDNTGMQNGVNLYRWIL